MKFSLMFFATEDGAEPYDLLLEAARFADAHGFEAVWTPEHHFDSVGGPFPNPALTSAALATVTSRVQLRAGSVILPLHDPLTIVEDWAVVDNLSRGRIALALGSGWNPDTFVLAPERFAMRYSSMLAQLAELRRLWSGEPALRANGVGQMVSVTPFPKPYQRSLPLWLTSTGTTETFRNAGLLGANVLTHLVTQDIEQLTRNLCVYRDARREAGHDRGLATVMLHTYLADDDVVAYREVREPLLAYLRSFLALRQAATRTKADGSAKSRPPDDVAAELLELAFERYCSGLSLIGSVRKCKAVVERLTMIGVDEIACLVDYGIQTPKVMRSLEGVTELMLLDKRQSVSPGSIELGGVS